MKFNDKAKELFEAAKMIRQYCSEIECKNCIFCIDRECIIDDIPDDWEIEQAEEGETDE